MRVEEMDREIILFEVDPVPFENRKHKLAVEPVMISFDINKGIGCLVCSIADVVCSVNNSVGHLHMVGYPCGDDPNLDCDIDLFLKKMRKRILQRYQENPPRIFVCVGACIRIFCTMHCLCILVVGCVVLSVNIL